MFRKAEKEITFDPSGAIDNLLRDARSSVISTEVMRVEKKLDALLDYLKLEHIDKVETNVVRKK